jgi:hypothetical protein
MSGSSAITIVMSFPAENAGENKLLIAIIVADEIANDKFLNFIKFPPKFID